MKKLYNMNMDVTDYLLTNNTEKVADLAITGSDFCKTASIHSVDERDFLDNENVALILFHPHNGELKKFACDTPGVTELNAKILASDINKYPEELCKIAANNLGYVLNKYKLEIPDELRKYQTNSWMNPELEVHKINKVAFYEKLEKHTPKQEASLEKKAEKILNKNLKYELQKRASLARTEEAKELYNDIIEKYANYSEKEIILAVKKADELGDVQLGIDKKIIKTAEDAVLSTFTPNWLNKLSFVETPFLSEWEKKALLSEEGEQIFESLPKPTKEKILEAIENA